MRKETKIGIIIGIIIVAGVAVYFVNQDKSTRAMTPDNFSMDDLETKTENSDSETVSLAETTPGSSDSSSLAEDSVQQEAADKTNLKEIETEKIAIAAGSGDITTDSRTDINIPLPSKPTKPEPTVTKAVKDDPLANLPKSYPEQITETKYHVVQKGDSLYSISTEYFGTGKYWKAIYEKNKDVIKNESALSVGWKIKIPKPEEIE